MPAAINISFQADLSNLTQQLARMPEITKKEAKEMVKALETQFKKAEKAAERAAKKTEAVFNRTSKGAKSAGKAMGDASGSMIEFGETAGDADSSLKAIGGALGLVSPEAEKAFSAMGDLAGGQEGLIKTLKASVGPFALVTAAVAAGAFAWMHYTEKMEAAEEQVKAAAEATKDMVRIVDALRGAQDLAELKMRIALGEEENEMLMAKQSELAAESKFKEKLHSDFVKEQKIRVKLAEVTKEQATQLHNLGFAHSADKEAYDKATKRAENLRGRLTGLEKITAKTRTEQQEYASTLFITAQAIKSKIKATKGSTKSTKKQVDAIGDLIDATKKLIPALPQTQIEKLAEGMTILETASTEGGEAVAGRLKPSMDAVADSIERLTTEEAAADLEALATAAATLTENLTPLDKATILLDQLNAAAAKSDEAAQKLAPDIEKVSNAIDKINTDTANEQLKDLANTIDAIAGPFQAALSNLGQLNLDAAMKEGGEALDDIGKRAEALEGLITGIDERIKASTDERVIAQLEAEKALIEGRIDATAAAKEKERAMVNEEVAKAFKLTKALNLSEIAMSTAVAVMKAWATSTAAAPFISAGIVALGATQAAIVASAEPPSLHLGGLVGPDERTITARTGEGVLTQQGVAAIGGASGLNAANRGAGSGAIVVQQVYKHRVLDVVLTDSIRRGGPITAELNKRSRRGRRNPHRRAG